MRFLILCIIILPLFAKEFIIDFQGNRTFSKERLYEELGFSKDWLQKLHLKPFIPKADEKLLDVMRENLTLFYKSQGFWDVHITLLKKPPKAIFVIYENRPIIVENITINSDFPIKNLIELKKGGRFITSAFSESKKNIKKKLLKRGFCSFNLNAKAYVYHKRHKAYLLFHLKKGKVCRIKSVTIHGLKTIPKKVVLSHIYLRPESIFNLEKVQESTRRLAALEFFRQIRFDYSRKIDNKILLDIFLKEKIKKYSLKAGVGYDTLNGIHFSLVAKYFNFHITQPTMDILYAQTEKKALFSLFIPSFSTLNLDTVLRFGGMKKHFEGFEKRSLLLQTSFLKKRYHWESKTSLTLERLSIFNASFCIPSNHYILLYPKLTLLFDKRDSKITPTKGFLFQSNTTLSLKAFSSSKFFKEEANLALWLPLASLTLYAKAHGGFLIARNSLPPSKLFYAGGAQSNRAYNKDRITALDSRCALGGNYLFETTIEPRVQLTQNLQGAIFWDNTYLAQRSENLFKRSIQGVGIGAIYQTPIGPLRAYFGIDPQKSSQYALHLFLGATF